MEEIDPMPDESWSGLIGAQQVRQTGDEQVPGCCFTDDMPRLLVFLVWRCGSLMVVGVL